MTLASPSNSPAIVKTGVVKFNSNCPCGSSLVIVNLYRIKKVPIKAAPNATEGFESRYLAVNIPPKLWAVKNTLSVYIPYYLKLANTLSTP